MKKIFYTIGKLYWLFLYKFIKVVRNLKTIDTIALILIIIGAINWGLIGLFKFDLVAMIFGEMSLLSRIVYTLVGISGLWGFKLLFNEK